MLFTFAGGTGHFLPTLPIARAASARGHQIVYGAQPMMLGNVEAAGFSAIDSGGPTMLSPSERRPLLPVDRAAEELVIRHSFAGRTAQERAGRLLDIASQWKPDVIIRDEVDFGAAVAAERLGIPHVSIIVLAAGGLVRADLVAEPLDALRAEHELAPDPDLAMLHRHLTIAPVPRSYRSPSDPLRTAAHHVRPDVLDGRSPAADRPSTVTDWLAEHSDRPTVYFTLGTIFHQKSGELLTRVVTALAGLTANVIVTCGNEIDPAELGGQPSPYRAIRTAEIHPAAV